MPILEEWYCYSWFWAHFVSTIEVNETLGANCQTKCENNRCQTKCEITVHI